MCVPKLAGQLKNVLYRNGGLMNPMEIPPVEILDDVLMPVRMIIERIYWTGFRDGAGIVSLIFFVVFILTNRGANR